MGQIQANPKGVQAMPAANGMADHVHLLIQSKIPTPLRGLSASGETRFPGLTPFATDRPPLRGFGDPGGPRSPFATDRPPLRGLAASGETRFPGLTPFATDRPPLRGFGGPGGPRSPFATDRPPLRGFGDPGGPRSPFANVGANRLRAAKRSARHARFHVTIKSPRCCRGTRPRRPPRRSCW